MKRVAVIGAGAAGLLAGAFAARGGCRTEIIERNEKAGKKLFLTGKGRCNITNSADRDEFMKAVLHNGRFLYSAFDNFFNDDIINIINAYGVKTKLERGGRYFPESDKSSDVIKALLAFTQRSGADILLNSRVSFVEKRREEFIVHIEHQPDRTYDALIIATGGLSYSSTGSTGDGYRFAKSLGHTVLEAKPSLIPFETEEGWVSELMGLSLKNVTLRAYKRPKADGKRQRPVYEELGEMLFTHFGVSGPLVLSASGYLADDPKGARLEIDLKPGLSSEQLDARLLRDFEKYKHKKLGNALVELLPSRLIDRIILESGIDPEKTVDNLTREERQALVSTLKGLKLTVKGVRPMEEAIITRGGIPIKEINPSTMESKLVPGLYFAGEVIDVDACTGGYNLQVAWSTGAAAGRAVSEA